MTAAGSASNAVPSVGNCATRVVGGGETNVPSLPDNEARYPSSQPLQHVLPNSSAAGGAAAGGGRGANKGDSQGGVGGARQVEEVDSSGRQVEEVDSRGRQVEEVDRISDSEDEDADDQELFSGNVLGKRGAVGLRQASAASAPHNRPRL